MNVFLGIDPGMTGALATIAADGSFIDVRDMPMVAKEVDPLGLIAVIEWARQFAETVRVAIEYQQVFPQNGSTQSFVAGHNYGMVKAVVYAQCCPVEIPRPARWKAQMGLSRDKDKSRELARQLFPAAADYLSRVKDDGRAEALLLAEWLRRQEGKRSGGGA